MTVDYSCFIRKKSCYTESYVKTKIWMHRYLGPFNDLENRLLYEKNTGDIYTYYDKPKNVFDRIASRHDTCYSIGKIKTIVIELWLIKLTIFLIKNDHMGHLL